MCYPTLKTRHKPRPPQRQLFLAERHLTRTYYIHHIHRKANRASILVRQSI
jgi:hypothetical protein